MSFNYLNYPYPSRRKVTFSQRGMVATSQPQAAQVGLDMLKNGGNAIDAAIATAACLTVVEPTSNGIGSDAFALIWSDNKLHGINGSGPAPQNISISKIKQSGYNEIPEYGWIPVTVPGAPGTWAKLSREYGQLPFTEVLNPAIKIASEGYPVSPTTGQNWNRAFNIYEKELSDSKFKYWFDTFAPGGKPPEIGEIWKSPAHARTLKLIAETESRSFYEGEIASRIIEFSKKSGGYLSAEDLSNFSPEWVDPINVEYHGYKVWEIPPNGQGLVALIALNILKGFEFEDKENVETYHKQMEAIKLAFSDGKKYITDFNEMNVDIQDLLSESYAASRRKLIGKNALRPFPGKPEKGGTVYLATADDRGNMVSFIQSNYQGFGSGLVVPDTGIALQNRGNNFSLDSDHDNCLKPGKRTYHTIIPGFLTYDDRPVGPFGVMGGFMQPQGHVQVLMNTINFNLNPQSALDAPRWRWEEAKKIKIEPDFPNHIAHLLKKRGHKIDVDHNISSFGRGQIIWKLPDGKVLAGGTEPRTDSSICCY